MKNLIFILLVLSQCFSQTFEDTLVISLRYNNLQTPNLMSDADMPAPEDTTYLSDNRKILDGSGVQSITITLGQKIDMGGMIIRPLRTIKVYQLGVWYQFYRSGINSYLRRSYSITRKDTTMSFGVWRMNDIPDSISEWCTSLWIANHDSVKNWGDELSEGMELKFGQQVFPSNELHHVVYYAKGVAKIERVLLYDRDEYEKYLAAIEDSIRIADSILAYEDSVRAADTLTTSILLYRKNKVGFKADKIIYDILGRILFRKE